MGKDEFEDISLKGEGNKKPIKSVEGLDDLSKIQNATKDDEKFKGDPADAMYQDLPDTKRQNMKLYQEKKKIKHNR